MIPFVTRNCFKLNIIKSWFCLVDCSPVKQPFQPAFQRFFIWWFDVFLNPVCVCLCAFVCSGISCMAQDCSLQMPEDFVLPLLPAEELKDKYRRYLFRDYVEVCVCLCVYVWDLFGQRVSRICSYGHWESRGMWERCENTAMFLSMSESLNLRHAFRPSASFPLWYSRRVMWHHGGSEVIATLFMFNSSVLFPCVTVSYCHRVVAIAFANNTNQACLILWLDQ